MKNFHSIVRSVLACAAVSAVLAGGNAWADLTESQAHSLEQEIAAGDKAGLKTLRTEARRGNKHAQFYLGDLYFLGIGVPRDYSQAAQWFRKAAEQGDESGQFYLGMLYCGGLGVPQDYSQAAQWLRKAAEQGDAFSQYKLGGFYLEGQGVPQDYSQAAQWFRKAAAQGNAKAQRALGTLYANGQGVPGNKVVAYALFNLSAARESSRDDHGTSESRSKVSNDMSAQAIEAGRALSREMMVSGNLLKALDGYMGAAESKSR